MWARWWASSYQFSRGTSKRGTAGLSSVSAPASYGRDCLGSSSITTKAKTKTRYED